MLVLRSSDRGRLPNIIDKAITVVAMARVRAIATFHLLSMPYRAFLPQSDHAPV
jgi:hypothetical protein